MNIALAIFKQGHIFYGIALSNDVANLFIFKMVCYSIIFVDIPKHTLLTIIRYCDIYILDMWKITNAW